MGPKLVSQHDEGLFLPPRFREILRFNPGMYRKPVSFFLRDIRDIGGNQNEGDTNLCLSDLKCTLRFHITPEFPGLMFCPGTTASFTVPWHERNQQNQLESTESI